jgi:hypothetical protein
MRHFLLLALAIVRLATGVQPLAAEGLLEESACRTGAICAGQGSARTAVLLTAVAARADDLQAVAAPAPEAPGRGTRAGV